MLIVGWQAPYTLGRRLADAGKVGQDLRRGIPTVRAEVVTIGGLSAHAGQDILLKYASASCASLKAIYLVHGEEKGALPLKALIEAGGPPPVDYPQRFDWLVI